MGRQAHVATPDFRRTRQSGRAAAAARTGTGPAMSHTCRACCINAGNFPLQAIRAVVSELVKGARLKILCVRTSRVRTPPAALYFFLHRRAARVAHAHRQQAVLAPLAPLPVHGTHSPRRQGRGQHGGHRAMRVLPCQHHRKCNGAGVKQRLCCRLHDVLPKRHVRVAKWAPPPPARSPRRRGSRPPPPARDRPATHPLPRQRRLAR